MPKKCNLTNFVKKPFCRRHFGSFQEAHFDQQLLACEPPNPIIFLRLFLTKNLRPFKGYFSEGCVGFLRLFFKKNHYFPRVVQEQSGHQTNLFDLDVRSSKSKKHIFLSFNWMDNVPRMPEIIYFLPQLACFAKVLWLHLCWVLENSVRPIF